MKQFRKLTLGYRMRRALRTHQLTPEEAANAFMEGKDPDTKFNEALVYLEVSVLFYLNGGDSLMDLQWHFAVAQEIANIGVPDEGDGDA